ncbi:MAG: tRNA threonylcarbamoyladenosine dehydratase [Muribaculaceae bacterium]|nr:tRNA threonylcarbamoyladenosine dehydratase [Muribaculaceae bacterium]
MQDQFTRTQMLLGQAAMDRLAVCRVAVFGVGGVGGYAVEVLARSGVGAIDIFDNDRICPSNINRQIIALTTNVGRYKVDVAQERIQAINPSCKVVKHCMFYVVANADEVDLSVYDYVVDCIDTVSAKMELIRRCKRQNVPIICSMGAANKLDATAFRVADITKTIMDPLAKVIRKRLRREGINHFKCVYSPEVPRIPLAGDSGPVETGDNEHRPVPASNAWVPAAAGLIIGGEVVKDLIDGCPGQAMPSRNN